MRLPFELRLAWWQIRGQGMRAWIIALCVCVGVAARVSVGALATRFDAALDAEARSLLTCDVQIAAREELAAERRDQLDQILPQGAALQRAVVFTSMARAPQTGRARTVVVQGIEPRYPFYGELILHAPDGARVDATALAGATDAAFVEPDLLLQLGVTAGAELVVGGRAYRIAGTIARMPGLSVELFSLGPRVLIARDQVPGGGLLGFGSLARFETQIRLPPGHEAEAVAQALISAWDLPPDARERLRGGRGRQEALRVRTPRDLEDRFRRTFARFDRFLRLIALAALAIGGVGVAGAARAYVVANIESAALLRVLGGSEGRLLRVFVYQVLLVSAAGALVGCGIGLASEHAITALIQPFLPMRLGFAWPVASLAWALLLGVGVAGVFALCAILSVVRVRPLAVLRGELRPAGAHPWWWATVISGLLALVGVAWIETRSPWIGLGFAGAVLGGALVIMLLGALLLLVVVWPGRRRGPFALRHALANLERHRARSLATVVAIGLVAAFLTGLVLYRGSLLRELRPVGDFAMPDLFAFNIDDEDKARLDELVAAHAHRARIEPMVPARLRSINGEPVAAAGADGESGSDDDDAGDERQRRMQRREQNLSWRDALTNSEELVAGTFFDPEAPLSADAPVPASVEVGFAEAIGAELGDILRFRIAGVVDLEARITSLRQVEWMSLQPNFFVLLPRAALADFPRSWVASVYCEDADQRQAVKQAMVRALPEVTVLDVSTIIARLQRVLEQLGWAIGFMAVFVLVAGLAVLAVLGALDARQRRGEAALLRVLGARARLLRRSLATEFALLGLAGALAGAMVAVTLAALLLERIELQFVFAPYAVAAVLATVVALSVLTGLLACHRVVRVPPLAILREE
ncbi:MAG: ABC transporter permease [Planctomycetota bacterium]